MVYVPDKNTLRYPESDVESPALLQGRVALITGGSAGIGLAIAARLRDLGATVVLIGRDPTRLAQAVQSLDSVAVTGWPLDVTQESDMNVMAARAQSEFERIDILIACAGLLRARAGVVTRLHETPLADWNRVLDANLCGTFLSNRAVLPVMIAQRQGQIINVASTSARRGHAYDSAYCASKFAVIGLSQALAEEVRSHGVRVQVILPGAIETPIWAQNGPIPPPRDVLPVERVTRAVVAMLLLPQDTVWPEVVIEPQRTMPTPVWSQSTAVLYA